MTLSTVFTQAINRSESYSVDEIFYRLDRRWLDSLYCLWLYQCDGLTFMHIDRLSRGVLTDVIGTVPRLSCVKVLANLDRFEEVVEW